MPENHFSESVTETRRAYQRESTPPREGGGSSALPELDALLQDLNEARYTGGGSFTGKDAAPATPGSALAMRTPLSDSFDMVPSPNAQTYETRTVTVTESVPEGCTNPASATQELDDLMASLSDFKIHAHSYQRTVVEETHEPPFEPERARELDTMLGSLQEDMSKQGVETQVKGTCAACEKPIAGQMITAMGETWHREHFTCAHCGVELGNKNFFERDGRPYCERDYHELFSPRCAFCEGSILDKCVTALGRTWHPEHFCCAACGDPFGEAGFHERDGKAYCRADYLRLFAPRCAGCQQPVSENYISALNGQWHPECFVCKDCQLSFENGSFFEYEGQPYCETHYHAKRGSLCAGCHEPIKGRCVTAMFRKYHPEHFVCSFCQKQLNKGTFKEQADKPYCHQCFDKLFG